jgi:hypothetical protein
MDVLLDVYGGAFYPVARIIIIIKVDPAQLSAKVNRCQNYAAASQNCKLCHLALWTAPQKSINFNPSENSNVSREDISSCSKHFQSSFTVNVSERRMKQPRRNADEICIRAMGPTQITISAVAFEAIVRFRKQLNRYTVSRLEGEDTIS